MDCCVDCSERDLSVIEFFRTDQRSDFGSEGEAKLEGRSARNQGIKQKPEVKPPV